MTLFQGPRHSNAPTRWVPSRNGKMVYPIKHGDPHNAAGPNEGHPSTSSAPVFAKRNLSSKRQIDGEACGELSLRRVLPSTRRQRINDKNKMNTTQVQQHLPPNYQPTWLGQGNETSHGAPRPVPRCLRTHAPGHWRLRALLFERCCPSRPRPLRAERRAHRARS